MSSPTESFADDAAIVAAESAHRLPPPATLEYPVDDYTRHVLIVEPSGLTYVAPHTHDSAHDPAQCLAIPTAFQSFVARPNPPHAPGRYWISVGDDGNLEIGSAVA